MTNLSYFSSRLETGVPQRSDAIITLQIKGNTTALFRNETCEADHGAESLYPTETVVLSDVFDSTTTSRPEEEACTPFCDSPFACRYNGTFASSGDIVAHSYHCLCHQDKCNRFYLQADPNILKTVEICGINVFVPID